ncbi:MAG: 50S ribosomal protein L6 [Tissierellales bacterium]
MSRIGLKPITIPSGVEINIDANNYVVVKGAKGKLEQQLDKEIQINKEENEINLVRPTEQKRHKAMHGLTRSLLNNMIEGVTNGYSKNLEIIGTGYRAQKQGNKLVLTLGFSHPVELEDPAGIEVEVPAPTKITIKGIDKQQVGNYAAVIRDFRRPEPYKGKGVRYEGEIVRRKEGKTGK